MANDPEIVQAVFLAAVERPVPDRAALLDRECGANVELRQRVEALLQAHDKPGSFLESAGVGVSAPIAPRSDPFPTRQEPISEGPGTVIGPYKLMEQIGEGGMGLVFVAEQQQPVRRKVALKVIKPGMDTRAVVARFEAERQALALMDHPNIAKVHDGGETASGRPYFVMELVKGVPISCTNCVYTVLSVNCCPIDFATPKSITFTTGVPSCDTTITLVGLMSRWMMPLW